MKKLVQEKIKIINQLNEQREKNRNDIITQKKLFINDKLLKDNEEIKKLFTTLGYNNNQQNVIDTLKIEKEKINQQNFQMLNKITEIKELTNTLNYTKNELSKTEELRRLRIGIENRENRNIPLMDFVLGKFTDSELEVLYNISFKEATEKIVYYL